MKGIRGIVAAAGLGLLGSVAATTGGAAQDTGLGRLVVIGDSLSAGFQSGCLVESGQANSYPARIAAQAGVPLPQPLITADGIPICLELKPDGSIGPIQNGQFGTRANPAEQALNLAVPGHNAVDALSKRPQVPDPVNRPGDILTDLILGLPGLFVPPELGGPLALSQVEWAELLMPDTILLWLGSNDALGAATFSLANPPEADELDRLTDPDDFAETFSQIMSRLSATGAKVAVANVPDVTVIAFLVPLRDVATGAGLPVELVATLLGANPDDFVTLEALPLVESILVNPATGPLPDAAVRDQEEIAAIQAAVESFNAVIAEEAAVHGAALVDIRGLLDEVDEIGIVVGGQRLTTDFLGGVFSLDGVHATNTGYALVANEFIRALNRDLGTEVPPLSVRQVQREDPLVLPFVGRPPAPPGVSTPDALEGLLRLF